MESVYNTYKAASGELLGSLLGGTALNYVGHRDCVCGDILGARKERKCLDMTDLDRQKGLMGGQERNSLKRETRNLRPSVEGVSYPVANEAVGWMVDSTACTTEGVKSWLVDVVYGNRVRRLEEELVY